MNSPTIELVQFRLKAGVDERTFLAAVADTQAAITRLPGFLSRELLRGDDGLWVDLVYWASQEATEAAMQNVAGSPVCHRYFALMAGADADELGAGVLHLAQVAQY